MLLVEFTKEIVRLAGLQAAVTPCTSAQYKAAHPRRGGQARVERAGQPHAARTVGDEMRPWQQALAAFFENWNGE